MLMVIRHKGAMTALKAAGYADPDLPHARYTVIHSMSKDWEKYWLAKKYLKRLLW